MHRKGKLVLHVLKVKKLYLDAYPTDAPGPCSQFFMEPEFLTCFSCFIGVILIISCSLLCVSVFHSWYLSLDYILLIFTRIFVPLISPAKPVAPITIYNEYYCGLKKYYYGICGSYLLNSLFCEKQLIIIKYL